MGAFVRSFLVCMMLGLAGFCFWPAAVLGGEGEQLGGSVSLLGPPTVIPNAESVIGNQRALAEEARRASPEAVAEREASRTAFVGLGREAAIGLADKTFGIERPSWISPEDEGDGHITKYVSETSAVEVLPDGKHLVLASTVPLRSAVGSGQLAPTSMTLRDQSGSFQPANPLVPVSIAKDAGGGASLPLGIRVAPAEAATPEPAELVGNSVVYPGTARDTDFIVEPVPSGIEASWQLRSRNSPQANSLVFTLPEGASLRMSPNVPVDAEVVEEGRTLLLMPPAAAREADGSLLPVSYSVSGSVLTTHVNLTGSVAFPVLVDPLVSEGFGTYGAGTWTGWKSADNCGTGCYGAFEHENQLITLISPATWPSGYWGEWYIYAPGNDSSIERVDLNGVAHGFEEGSNMWAEIGYSSGSNPVWTFNAYAGAQGVSPYFSNGVFEHQAMAFCAQGAGGKDGEAQPLCDPNYGGEYFRFGNETRGWTSQYNFTEISGAVVKYLDTVPPYLVRLWGLKTTWTKTATYSIEANDEGLGIAGFTVEIPPGYVKEEKAFFAENVSCPSGGIDGCPKEAKSKPVNFSPLGTGVYTLGVYAEDEAGNTREEEVGTEDEEQQGTKVDPKLYLDETPPKMAPLTGTLAEANGGVIGSGNYTLNFSAEDGSPSAPQSGVYKLVVYVDGRLQLDDVTSCPTPHGIPSPSCYGFNGSWNLEGQKFGAGPHTITVTAIDWAGNESTESIHVTMNEAPYEAAGPGEVNLKTGDYKLVAGDVSVAAGGADLGLTRSYDSRQLTAGSEGPLGPQWSLGVPDAAVGGTWQSLQVLPSGSVQLTAVNGERVTFASNGSGGYISPAGYQTDTLAEPSKSPAEYRLTSAEGNATTFTRVSSGSEEAPLFVPSGAVQAESAGGLDKTSYLFSKTTEGVVEPTAVVAPYLSTFKCVEKLEKHEEIVNGCRALTFTYATETKKEGSSEWGEYKGRLVTVSLKAWSKSAGKIITTPVARYAYDSLGRLHAEWNPEISPALKTVYGYDTEGHVTAVTAPGQETWTLTYGTIGSDSNTGRLIKATQAPAAAKLWGGQAPKNTEVPKLSGTAVVGVTMGASSGGWGNEPVSYSYQWEDCNSEGKSCTAILGATNADYTITSSDVGHTLVSQIAATNGGGTVSATTAASVVVASSGTKTEGTHYNPGPGVTVEYHVALSGAGLPTMTKAEVEKWGQKIDVPFEATAILPPDKAMGWPAKEYTRATIYYLDSSERVVNVSLPTGGISTTEYNSHNSVLRVFSPDNRATWLGGSKTVEAAEKLSTKNVYNSESTELEETFGPEHEIKLTGGSEVQARKKVKYTYNEEGAPTEGRPFRLVTSTKESALVAGKEEESRIVTDSYSGQENFGWKLHAPTSTITDPEGLKLVHTTVYSTTTGQPIETKMPASSAGVSATPIYTSQFGTLGAGNGQMNSPRQLALNGIGDIFIADEDNNRVEELNEKGEYIKSIGAAGSGNGQLSEPKGVGIDKKGNIWVADTKNNRIEEFNEKGEYVRAVGSLGSEHGQFKEPKSIATDSHNNVFVADSGNNRVQEFNEKGEFVLAIGSVGTGNGNLKEPRALTLTSAGFLWVADTGNNRLEEFNEKDEFVRTVGSAGSGSGQFKEPKGITSDTHGNIWVTDTENNRIQEFNEKGEYELQFGSGGSGNGQFNEAWGIQVNASNEVFVADSENNRIQKWVPANPLSHNSQITYYSASTESSIVSCQNHPEWVSLPCQIQPVHQPEVSGVPALPVTTYIYNIWDEPEVTKSTSGEATRTDTDGYDVAGRLASKETTSTNGAVLQKIKYEYNSETGLLTKQSTGSGSEEKKITSLYNTLGELTSYTDAEGSTTSYEYEKEQDARLKKITDPKGTQTYNYSTTTGTVNELVDSAAGTFTASYDVEGNMVIEGYPNGMNLEHTYNPAGEATSLKYRKITHCTEEVSEPCVMFKDAAVSNIHGEWTIQTSSLSSQNYSYDKAGRLSEVQSTPVGNGCGVRLYTYDADGDRTSLVTRSPGTEGKCATEGGSTESHSYDTADRLMDTGVAYDPFGDVTTLGATDAGGSELKSEYYSDGQLASQEQAGQTIGYNLDPARRTREIVSTGKTTSDVLNHYDSAGSTPSWTALPSGETTRNIFGINGTLAAIQYNGEKPTIQLANLHGDIIGTAKDSETEIHPESTTDTTEYGVPTTSKPPKYSWLGTDELPTELPSGVIGMGARSYVPEIGRFLQPDPSPGGAADAYGYTQDNPLNESDPSGEWTQKLTSGGISAVGTGEGVHLTGGVGIAEGAIMPEPVNLQIEAAFRASPPWDQITAGNEEYEEYEEEWWEEEGEEWEYASYKRGLDSGEEEGHIEPAPLIQSLTTAEGSEDATPTTSWTAPLCKAGSEGPCARDIYGIGGHGGGKKRVKKLKHANNKGPEITCGDVGGVVGGALGTAVGGVFGDVPGAYAGSAVGGVAGSHIACGK